MNIFGLFFSFFIPGFIIGMAAMAAVYAGAKKKRRVTATTHRRNTQRGLHLVYSNAAPKSRKDSIC